MPFDGKAMMMQALGLDPEELKLSAEAFMANMKQQAETINANQRRLEDKLDAAGSKLGELADLITELVGPRPSTTAILENGRHTGVLITDEKFPQEMIDDVNGG